MRFPVSSRRIEDADMADPVLDLSQPIKPLVFDPGRNEWILKQRKTPATLCVDTKNECQVPEVTETEFLGNDGKMHYQRVAHYRLQNRWGDEVQEEGSITASRLPGPTNGGLDLDPRTRWVITGTPLPTFATKTDDGDLELRLRIVFALAIPKVGPQVGEDLINMLKDPATIVMFVAGIIGFIAVHLSSPTGIGALIAFIMDVITAAFIGFTLGRQAIPFFKAFLDFLELVVDGETDEDLDQAATFLAQMISIIAVTAITIAATVILKRVFSTLRARAPAKVKGPIKDAPPLKRRFWWVPSDPIGSQVALTEINGALLKDAKVLEAAKAAWKESYVNYRTRFEQGFFIVEEADGSLGVIRWTKGAENHITMPAVEPRPGRGAFFQGKKVRGTLHTHPIGPSDAAASGNPKLSTVPSKADGVMADTLFRESKGSIVGEHYVVAGDNVYVYDHAQGGRFALVGRRIDILGR
jgi:hypothetical protein